MSLTEIILNEELVAATRLVEYYSLQLESCPKGTLSYRKVGNRRYAYLKYREGKKTVSRYVRADEIETVKESLSRRDHLKAMLRKADEERKLLLKMIGRIK